MRERDVFCLMTAHTDGVERAYIIPPSEKDWFGGNGMAHHAPNHYDPIHSESNAILLREDVHTLWDKMYFSIVPKPDFEGRWVLAVHVHYNTSPSVHQRYHNTHLHPLRGVSPEYLFARFARDVFPHLHPLLRGDQARWLALRANGEIYLRQFTAQECTKMCSEIRDTRNELEGEDLQNIV